MIDITALPNSRTTDNMKYWYSETVPWCTDLSENTLLLGHGDGSVNVVNIESNDVITVQQHTSGVLLLRFIDQM